MAGLRTLHAAASTGSPLWDLVILAVVAYAAHTAWVWYRLRHIPGPLLYSLSSLPLLKCNLSGHSHAVLNDLTNKYGPLVRIGPNTVLTSDVKLAQRMEAPKSPYTKGAWYGTFRFQKGAEHSFCMRDEKRHAALRTKVGPGYSASHLVEDAIDRQLGRLFRLVDRAYLSTEGQHRPVDFAVLTQLLSIDIVGDMTFGEPFGFLDEGRDIYDWVAWNESFFPVASTAAALPLLARLVQTWPFSELLPKPSDPVGLGRFIRFAQETIEERFQPKAEARRDMIALFLKHGATREEATGEALVQVVAGTDSVAVAIRMTLLYLLSTPRVYNRLLAELTAAVAAGQLARPVVREAETRRLPYLQAVVREGLRVFPSLTPLLAKAVPAGGDVVVGGHFLPAGTELGLDGWGVLRSPAYWGPDAAVFRPERWLEAQENDPARADEMAETLEVLFGYGKNKCLGRGIAFMEINKVLVELLLRYDLTVIDPTHPIKKMKSAAFWLMTDFWVTITPRAAS